jgi:hypothetical protein
MFKVRIKDKITDNSLLTNKAYYLYVYLKLYAKGNQYIYIYLNELMELIQWKDKKTVKKYLIELKNLKYIYYEFNEDNPNNFPINQPLHINILDEDNSEQYTQIDINTILKLQKVGKEIRVVNYKDKNKITIISDLKEVTLRLFYLYEKNYFRKQNNGTKITYANIQYITKSSDKNIKAINNTLVKNDMLEIIVGKRFNSDSRRTVNEYKPICEITNKKVDNTDSEK